MTTSNWRKRFTSIMGAAVAGLMLATVANAANPEPVAVEVEFVIPITIAEVASLRFGLLDVNLSGVETVVIDPDNTLTDAGGNVLGGTQAAADLTITTTGSLQITILVDNVSVATGYTLGTWLCNYDGAGADSACDGAGYTETSAAGAATLLVGVTLSGNGSAVVGDDSSTFDVTVTYQ